MKFSERHSSIMIMDKSRNISVISKTKNISNEGGKKFTLTRRGSVDSGMLGFHHQDTLHTFRDRSSSHGEKRTTKTSYTGIKKDKDFKLGGKSSSLGSDSKNMCQSELKPILKCCITATSIRGSVSLDDAVPSCNKEKQTKESKFSYRLPIVKKTIVRKNVSFSEDVCDFRMRPRRYSSPSLTFSSESSQQH